ncbi:hypothetical protein [Sulfurimonas sp.]|uniref:hypothetical protein n=1 Tax=Sulfurimonas sp. TaxID=2022749 RepID=UPI0025F406B0|nr:hypothetical protein [Sulfurimonas sp.]
MLTVREAQHKICPFISMPMSVDRRGYRTNNTFCIAYDCMAWVTTQTHEQIENKPESNGNKDVCMSRFRDGKELSKQDQIGFCKRLSR